jgi:glycolate oxidase FAD binding subunit
MPIPPSGLRRGNRPCPFSAVKRRSGAFPYPQPPRPISNIARESLIEWGGALRWLRTDLPTQTLRRRVAALGGHATLFRGHHGAGRPYSSPWPPAMLALHQRIKLALDPHGLFNPGRMYEGL